MPLTAQSLRDLYGNPSDRSASKVVSRFDKHCRQFIENSTFLVLATHDGNSVDVSPKGDTAGFVNIETDQILLLPDRPGNNRIDGLLNILKCPHVALIFMIPNVGETLRVNGMAEILTDQQVCDQFVVKGRSPKTVLRIRAQEIFTHCGKAPLRGGLWKPDTWPKHRPIASLNEIVRDHSNCDVDSLDQSAVEEGYARELY